MPRENEHVMEGEQKNLKVGHCIVELPNDCLRTICSFLSKKGLLKMSLTSKSFRTIIFGSIENAYNQATIELFYNRGIYEVLKVQQSVVSRLDAMVAMRKKLHREIIQEQLWTKVASSRQCAGFIHEISNWAIMKETNNEFMTIKIDFDWTRGGRRVHFYLEYLGDPVYGRGDDHGYVLCAKYGLNPTTGEDYDVSLISCMSKEDDNSDYDESQDQDVYYPIFDRNASHCEDDERPKTSKQVAMCILEFLDPEMKPIDLIYSLYHLFLMEPYPSCEIGHGTYCLTRESGMNVELDLLVKRFHFLDDASLFWDTNTPPIDN